MGMKKHLDRRTSSGFKIQITSLVDVFVIMLVFLLKSYSTNPVAISVSKDLTLPESTSIVDPKEVINLVVARTGIFVESEKVLDLVDGVINSKDLDPKDSSNLPILFKVLDEHANKLRKIANVNETVQFDGNILLQADRSVPYELLQKVLYTSTMAGYANLKLAVYAK